LSQIFELFLLSRIQQANVQSQVPFKVRRIDVYQKQQFLG